MPPATSPPENTVPGQDNVDTFDPSVPRETVDPQPVDNTPEDLERARNPLGYTVTEPTEAEMESRSSIKGNVTPSDFDLDADETDLDIESETPAL
jgi:hypothetical protein